MSYFDEVYVKRLNQDGFNQQDRVKTRKEKEFDKIFLKKSEYRATICGLNDAAAHIDCSLQPNKWNEVKEISNLLISTANEPLDTGNLLIIKQRIKDKEYIKKWLIIHCAENLTQGYLSYKIICLDSVVNLTDEYGNTQKLVPAKFTNSSSKLVVDTFILKQTGYEEPKRTTSFVTQNQDFLKKGTYFEYKNKGFEIMGIDDISVEGVVYVTVAEQLLSEVEPSSSEDILVGSDTNFFLNNR